MYSASTWTFRLQCPLSSSPMGWNGAKMRLLGATNKAAPTNVNGASASLSLQLRVFRGFQPKSNHWNIQCQGSRTRIACIPTFCPDQFKLDPVGLGTGWIHAYLLNKSFCPFHPSHHIVPLLFMSFVLLSVSPASFWVLDYEGFLATFPPVIIGISCKSHSKTSENRPWQDWIIGIFFYFP